MTKNELKSIQKLDRLIKSKIKQLNELRSLRYTVKTILPKENPTEPTPYNPDNINLVDKIVDLENEINKDIDLLVKKKEIARCKINQIEGIYGAILELRYLCDTDWRQIAKELNYSIQHILKLHGEAFKKNKKYLIECLTHDSVYAIIYSRGEKMASVEKIIDKMKRQPNNISPAEMQKVLKSLGYEMKRGKGDHENWRKAGKPIFTLVLDNPVKKYQVVELLKIIRD